MIGQLIREQSDRMKIWKFPIETVDQQSVSMPEGTEIISVAVQYRQICMWAVVDPGKPATARNIEIIGTGNPTMPLDKTHRRAFIGTVFQGPFVWHVFEVVKA